ncbi:MAG: hypothetical protein L0216_21445 [Planctomycetales bacterium]|nr:hypothetical protein [Planctomycetales bacterium]
MQNPYPPVAGELRLVCQPHPRGRTFIVRLLFDPALRAAQPIGARSRTEPSFVGESEEDAFAAAEGWVREHYDVLEDEQS